MCDSIVINIKAVVDHCTVDHAW